MPMYIILAFNGRRAAFGITYSRKLIPCSDRPLSLYELYNPNVAGINPIYSQICHKHSLYVSPALQDYTHACNQARCDSRKEKDRRCFCSW